MIAPACCTSAWGGVGQIRAQAVLLICDQANQSPGHEAADLSLRAPANGEPAIVPKVHYTGMAPNSSACKLQIENIARGFDTGYNVDDEGTPALQRGSNTSPAAGKVAWWAAWPPNSRDMPISAHDHKLSAIYRKHIGVLKQNESQPFAAHAPLNNGKAKFTVILDTSCDRHPDLALNLAQEVAHTCGHTVWDTVRPAATSGLSPTPPISGRTARASWKTTRKSRLPL